MTEENDTGRAQAAEHLGFELTEGEGFRRDRVSVFWLLNLLTQSYAEHQMAGFEADRPNPNLAAFLREVTGLFQGRYPDILQGYGKDEGWSGERFNGWLRSNLTDELTDEEKKCFAFDDDDYLVALAVSKMAVELHRLFVEQLQEETSAERARAIGSRILALCAHWSLILSGDETPLPDFAQEDDNTNNNDDNTQETHR